MNELGNIDLLDALGAVVGPGHVITDEAVKGSYETDWTRRWTGRATAVLRPADANEVGRCVALCAASSTPIIPQGGNTGLVGGATPGSGDSVILSTRRIDSVGMVDVRSGQIDVGAGVTLERLQEAVSGTPWEVGVDLAARSSATIGGMVATNAGGTRVLRHGMMRRQVAGVEFVTANGAVVRSMRGLVKDNTGYDLVGLMCGSEGTLGVITRVLIQLVPRRAHRVTVLRLVSDLEAAARLVSDVRARVGALDAAEYVSGATLEQVCSHSGRPDPLPGRGEDGLLLLEFAAPQDPMDDVADVVDDPSMAVVASERSSREGLWEYREAATESIAALGIPHKLDVTLPLGRMGAFESALTSLVSRHERSRLFLFGHVADGGVHVNVIPGRADDLTLDREVLELAAAHGGSISAEHGVGRSKAPDLHMTRSALEIEAMRWIKMAFDPAGILNPGVLLAE